MNVGYKASVQDGVIQLVSESCHLLSVGICSSKLAYTPREKQFVVVVVVVLSA